ncbi:MAG TPA: LCP family protein [Symbiobacteriaceae bacterium]|nr:LCP family protein [Symbiobacteriaceae bacterium]
MRRRRRHANRGFWAGVIVGLLIPLAGLVLWMRTPATDVQPAATENPAAADRGGEPTHILVLGVDERQQVDGSRTDTMMLVRVAGGQVRVLAIPRDTLVHMEGHDDSKINSAYTYGGTDLAKEVAGDLLGVQVDHYVKINLAGFRHVVDLMGGVQFDVPKAMHYVDPTDGTYIDLEPGLQLLDGEKAEQFVRFRHDEIGDDMGRIHRQQEFLKAAVAQALTPSNWLKLPQLLYTARGYVETDIPVTEQLKLAQSAYKAQQSEAIVQETLPGHGDYVDGISFYLVDEEQLDRLVSTWEGTGRAQ